ncbi:MAG: ABC transporter substrate-binding protein [Propionibacteriales bacterium]|nr:ABC transporter substrate-binding protein [Propionibacteriales bacterium]
MKARSLAAAAAALTLLVAGCGGGGNPGGDTSSAGGDKTVRLALTQDVETLLPMDSNVGDNIGVLEVVYDGLVRYDAQSTKPYNYIAEDVSSTDKTTWTIKLKPDFTFQNGEPVDAASFARAWNYAAYGPNGMANNYFFERFVGYDEMQGVTEEDDDGKITVQEEPKAKELSGLKVVDPTTLTVELTGPFVGFPTMLGYTGFFPIAQACLDDIEGCAKKPIGNGPFQIDQWEQGVRMSASKWADYKGSETPNYNKIEWTEYKGSSSWPDFQAGDLDTGAPPPSEWQSANNDPDLTSRKVVRPGAALTYIGFPLYKGAPYTNIEFRKAISMAIDRQAIIDQVLPGQEVPADSWVVPNGVPGGVAGTCADCKFDPTAAKAALAKAGGWPKGQKLKISLGQDDANEQYFQAIGNQIKLNLGIDYELDPAPDFFARRAARKFDGAFRNNWFPDYPLNENYLVGPYASGDAKNGNDTLGFYSKAFEDKLAEGDKAPDLDTAVTKYQEAEQELAKEFPTVPISFSQSVAFYSENVDNVVLDPFSGSTKLRLLNYVG